MACDLYLLNGSSFSPMCEYDNGQNLDAIYYWLYGVLMTVVIIFGLIGNGVTICVFLSPRIWSCLSFYLVALASWDSSLLISSFTQWSLWSLWHGKTIPLVGEHVVMLRISYFLVNITLTGCVWVTVCLTVERYLAISFPLRHRTFNNGTRAKILISCISVGAVLVNISRLFEVEIIYDELYNSPMPNSTDFLQFPFITRSHLRDNLLYFVFYRVLAASLLTYVIPCGVLLVLTAQMCWSIRASIRQRQQICLQTHIKRDSANLTGKKRHSSQNTNITLIIVLIKFLICYALPTVIDLMELFNPYQQVPDGIETLIIVSNLLVVLNSSTNFYIYMFQCRRFGEELQRGCSCLFGRAKQFDGKRSMKLGRATSDMRITNHSAKKLDLVYGTFGIATPRSISVVENSKSCEDEP